MSDPRLFSAFLNDPGGKGDAPEVATLGCCPDKFAVPGLPKDGDLDTAKPGSVAFQASHLLVILSHAYEIWRNYFGAPFDWEIGKTLPVQPRAGRDLNAYYDRIALKFFYTTDPLTQRTIYTCESSDVAAHECGHAILDAHHPDYWSSLHPETAAFHEAFGDITALLTTLQFPTVRERLLKETGGDLSVSSNVTRFAEQLGKALYVAFGKEASGASSLRDLVNTFRYKEPWTLLATAPATRLSSEPHSFSRIWSGAVYQILVNIYQAKRSQNERMSADDALCQARDDVGKLMANALLLAPPGDAVFRVIAAAMFKAEQQLFRGAYFEILKQIFSNRRILQVKDANLFQPHTKTVGAKMSSVNLGLLSVAGAAAEPMPPAELQNALRLRGEELIFARELGRIQDDKVVQYRAQRMIPLKGKQFGPANGAMVPLQGGLTLNVNPKGMVAFSGYYRAGVDDVRAIRDNVEKLAERKRIYDARPGDKAEIAHLLTRQQPFYIAYDEQGNKILRRAFIACRCRRA
ncbi:hypothetical protein FBQ82_08385 [Anaerolineae bacterium CFX7]|nr:hypothetical protein [Anaerolineae bacterium CFX7]